MTSKERVYRTLRFEKAGPYPRGHLRFFRPLMKKYGRALEDVIAGT